ncbi:DUF1707 domain-containing protein [Streptomyces sp. A3M-1-3]|uniref:DUF1707 SHOCT-like domain-containing protein n=1 Tax=Streptomyces sp. A3M-1-3 TaxID=2962044 RepID=UPI0020B735E9|nr:DUF1707 domain-containing protein [Streptomyces sp. A3M-1-3]MCP3821604.1 DUF1707 domain-containing protein [Streptomyces sp. A3M-1-3]
MSSLRIGHAEQEQALERLKTAFAEGRLDQAEFENRVGRTVAARTEDQLGAVLAGLPAAADLPECSTAGSVSLRDRVADRLVRALRCAVFCWLPPPSGRDQPGR